MNRTRLVVLGAVLAVATIIVAIGSASADAAYRNSISARLNGYTSGAPSQSDWVLAWVLGIAAEGALIGACLMGGQKRR